MLEITKPYYESGGKDRKILIVDFSSMYLTLKTKGKCISFDEINV